ncbi:MAG: ATP phosphoribosyltransferase regulatory subunit [Clostridium sp.]|jgi:ATP phosphoribosyltransferase regulatory subunit|nr:ATP phosphoribosyltransferase regulatory subunit [Clostridium sp.]
MRKRLLHTPEGVRDIYGTEYVRKRIVQQKLQETIQSFGYQEIQTPTFEFFDVFSREIGTTPSKDLYKFFDKEGNTLVLRPDFTPSIARCASKYFMEETDPLRFCYTGSAFLNTSNLQGKWKEVTQVGAELMNDHSVEADAEIISLVVEALRATGLKRFQLTVGQVEYFKGLCQEAGLEEETEYELREYISGKNYFAAEELLRERAVAEPYRGILLKVADMFGNMTSLAEAKALVRNPRSVRAIERLENIYEVLKYYRTASFVSFDLGLLSKYRYYTGIIFKGYAYGVGSPVVTGGRYDHLLEQFGKNAPAIGCMVMLDELLAALSGQKVEIPLPPPVRRLYYTSEDYPEKLAQAQALRASRTAAELTPARDGSRPETGGI